MTLHLSDIRSGGLLLALLLTGTAVAEPLDFNRDIRPILSENCFYCHGQDGNKREADLRLDQRDPAVAASPRDAAVDAVEAVEQAALASICLAILNLDEALTRE